jgi:hypothetical protein
MDVRRFGREARREQVALSHGRVQARLGVDQGKPTAHPDPPEHRPMEGPVYLYHQRGAVEREFGRLKHEWGMLPLRVRRIARVRMHVDLTILAKLASALLAIRA